MKTKIKIFAIFTFSLFALALFAPKSQMQATQQTETAGQKFKNIKVLTDMPADQLGRVMNIMAASLGVNCNFCHVQGDFSKDDKPEKETARQMIRMTLDINKNNFNGRTEVSCNTCHRGSEHPQSAINLNAVTSEERPKQPDVKPTADAILEKYVQAVGGRENIAKITSRVVTANRVEPNGKVEPEEILQKGDKLYISTKYPQATVLEVYNGTNAWKRSDRNLPLRADEVEQIRRNAQFFAFSDLKSIYPKMDFRAVDRIDGHEVYMVLATTADNQRERLYFDTTTGLLVRRVSSSQTVLGNYTVQVDYSDYKDFGGVKLPTTIRYAMPNMSWTRKITDVKNNEAIEDAKFNPPA